MKNLFFRMGLLSVVAVFLLAISSYAKTNDMVYSGYLADKLCADAGIAFDGTNMKTNPENHTLKCLVAKPCAASGYGLLLKDKGSNEYVFYKFDAKGDELTKKMLSSTKKQKDFAIEVAGTMDGKTIKVESVKEAM